VRRRRCYLHCLTLSHGKRLKTIESARAAETEQLPDFGGVRELVEVKKKKSYTHSRNKTKKMHHHAEQPRLSETDELYQLERGALRDLQISEHSNRGDIRDLFDDIFAMELGFFFGNLLRQFVADERKDAFRVRDEEWCEFRAIVECNEAILLDKERQRDEQRMQRWRLEIAEFKAMANAARAAIARTLSMSKSVNENSNSKSKSSESSEAVVLVEPAAEATFEAFVHGASERQPSSASTASAGNDEFRHRGRQHRRHRNRDESVPECTAPKGQPRPAVRKEQRFTRLQRRRGTNAGESATARYAASRRRRRRRGVPE
jgi:hypothetical protein